MNVAEKEETPAGQDYLLIFFILQLVTSPLGSQESPLQALYSVEIFPRVTAVLNVSYLIILPLVLDTKLSKPKCSMFGSKQNFQSLLICTGFNQ